MIFNSKHKNNQKKGLSLVAVLIFGTISTVLIIGLTSWFAVTLKITRRTIPFEVAFQIAEAGIDYYEWHLAHEPEDYQDGTGVDGPYVHDFFDKDGNKIGEYSLEIVAPEPGSSVVEIISTGTSADRPDVSRTIKVRLLKPTVANYAFLSNSNLFIRPGAEIFGEVHSNGGIRFDGIAHNVVSSALSVYDDPEHSGDNEYAIHTHINPVDGIPPSELTDRLDIFESGRNFPVPAVDFDSITMDMANIKTLAQDDGLYFTQTNKEGYHMVLKTDDTFDLYEVDKVDKPTGSCKKPSGEPAWRWSTWSIDTESFIGNYDFPNNGTIFLEDHVWIDGQIDGARLTITAGRFPGSDPNMKNITINSDLKYTNFDGQDIIGLIAQKDINVGLNADDDLVINAALVAKEGRVGRHYYEAGCPNNTRSSINILGTVISNEPYGFSYTDDTGYQNRTISYDINLKNFGPLYFPNASQDFQVISWEEIEN